jgi:ubiquinone/menaquinone biosynthesis C-methylase UbiE
MISWIRKYYFKLQVKLLITFKPTVLFDKINQLAWYENMLHQWVADQALKTKSKVLEIGCATGILTHYLVKSGYVPTGIDYSNKMINIAKNKYHNIDFLEADIHNLPFENNAFDNIIAASVINIISDKNKALSELFRVCKKGGGVSVLVPLKGFNNDDLHALQKKLTTNADFSAIAMEAWHKNPPKMTINELISLFKQAGLTEITSQNYLEGMVFSVSAKKPL